MLASSRAAEASAAKWRDVAWAIGLGVLTVVVVGATAQSLGFTRDEVYYFKAGELYWGWFRELGRSITALEPWRPFSKAVIDQHWSYNHEHPVLLKTLFALSFGAREVLGLDVEVHDALRFPAWVVAGLSTSLVFALARVLLPLRAAVVAALLWVAMPHVFWHMHVACFDVGVAAAHTALVLAYWRWRHTFKGAIAVGVVFGVAAGVKHNVLPVPALLVLHWLIFSSRNFIYHLSNSAGSALKSARRASSPEPIAITRVMSAVPSIAHNGKLMAT